MPEVYTDDRVAARGKLSPSSTLGGPHVLPRHPMDHRQRRPLRAAPDPRPPRARARGRLRHERGEGGHATPASSAAGRRPASAPRTTPRRCSRCDADCVVYTATADRRPFDAVKDVARILAAGQERRVELDRRPRPPARARRPRDRAARGRLRARARPRSSRPASTRASRTTSCRSCSPASAARGRRSASRRSSTTRPTRSPRCSSTRWASASRSTRSR